MATMTAGTAAAADTDEATDEAIDEALTGLPAILTNSAVISDEIQNKRSREPFIAGCLLLLFCFVRLLYLPCYKLYSDTYCSYAKPHYQSKEQRLEPSFHHRPEIGA